MRTLLNWLTSFISKEQLLFDGKGLYSTVKVIKQGSRVKLFTGSDFLQSSFDSEKMPIGTVFDWYLIAPWFLADFNGKIDQMLIIGLGAGSIVKLFNKSYTIGNIVGLEIDPLIIELGKKYFDLNDSNLEIVNNDAKLYLENNFRKFDFLIVDAYKENVFESFFESLQFLEEAQNHLSDTGVLLINRVLCDYQSNVNLENKLKLIFKTVFAMKVYNNVFYISTNSPYAFKSEKEVFNSLVKASKANSFLSFFRRLKLANVKVTLTRL